MMFRLMSGDHYVDWEADDTDVHSFDPSATGRVEDMAKIAFAALHNVVSPERQNRMMAWGKSVLSGECDLSEIEWETANPRAERPSI